MWILSAPSHTIFWRSILMLSLHLHLVICVVSTFQASQPKFSMNFPSVPCVPHSKPFHLSWFGHADNIWSRVVIMNLLITYFSAAFCLIIPHILLRMLFSDTLIVFFSFSWWGPNLTVNAQHHCGTLRNFHIIINRKCIGMLMRMSSCCTLKLIPCGWHYPGHTVLHALEIVCPRPVTMSVPCG